jgi:hypothetical protein
LSSILRDRKLDQEYRGGSPKLAVEQYAATLLRWFGLAEPQIDAVAPGLAAFSVRDLGFFA